ncbi:hypothetical protein [Umezawaea sp.]|uniref:hypothetical protein n=1 Tax=Umezawaea sp. TaxID=1955258 RepID=UPI002ED592CA
MPGPGEFGPDGTQDPPPPRAYPDALAGLVTGETPYRPKRVAPPVQPAYSPVAPDPELAREAIRTAMLHEQRARPVRTRQPQPQTQVGAHRVQYRAPVAPTPQAHPQAPPQPQQAQGERPRSRGSAFGGCLVALLIIGSVFFNVIRQVVEALLDAIR